MVEGVVKMNMEAVVKELDSLPPEKQEEVADFVAFLHLRTTMSASEVDAVPEPKGFVGMWADRLDMRNTGAWLQRVREREWMGHDA